MSAQVVLITGATDGLGRAVARDLAAAGATVLIHGRSDERLAATLDELAGDARAYRADLSSLTETRALADEVLANEERLDVLVNNAGIGTTLPGDGRRLTSRDGYELRFAVNYLSHFALTRALEPLLIRSAPSRIVNVSSAGQMPIDFADVMLERGYSGTRAYCQSKLAQVMFTIDLAERLRDHSVIVNCLHPATYMPTKMVLAARGRAASSIEEGTRATLRLITDEQRSGLYFDGVREGSAHPQAYDAAARAELRRLSEELTAT